MGRIISKQEYKLIKQEMDNKKVGLCHGVFDLIHPGHIIHFEEAVTETTRISHTV